jgi:hypothetical protein
LKRGIYLYKYIVDGIWHYSPEEKTANDGNGNINNILDLTEMHPNTSN